MGTGYVYMKITKDKYMLPVAIGESVQELADICGTTTHNIAKSLYRRKKNGLNGQYIKVVFEEGDEE